MEEFLYDRIVKGYEKRLKLYKEKELIEPLKMLKNEAKVILIDEMTLDSLANEPYSDESFYGEVKLPFPHTFFEFGRPLKYTELLRREAFDLGAILFSESTEEENETNKEEISEPICQLRYLPKNLFDIFLFNENGSRGKAQIHFSETSPFIAFQEFDSEGKQHLYMYNAKERTIIPIDDLVSGKDFKVGYLKKMGDEELNPLKLANLSVNIINYINAQNITIKKAHREKKAILMPSSKKKRPKRFLIPTKPYYWIEIEKHVYEEKEGEPGHSWELEYRVWVRGHFRHYKDGKRIWIEPYVKGPLDAPWKYNRYKVLYDKFNHLLKNPKYINDNSQKNPF